MWKITKETVTEGTDLETRVGFTSPDYVEGTELPFKFRMKDDDGEIYYWGLSDDNNSEEAFAPLYDLGEPDAGCTSIEYYNNKVWEVL